MARDIRRSRPNFLRLRGGRSILLMLSNRRLSILLFRFSLLLLERTSATSSQIVLTNSLKLKQTHVRDTEKPVYVLLAYWEKRETVYAGPLVFERSAREVA